jgi:hypothetical protein
MRVKNAISGVLMLVLGFTVGSAAAMLAMAPGAGVDSTKLSQGPATLTLDHNWNITGIVTPDHHLNITGTDTNNPLLRSGQRGDEEAPIATPPPQPLGKRMVRANLLMLALILAGGRRHPCGSPSANRQ